MDEASVHAAAVKLAANCTVNSEDRVFAWEVVDADGKCYAYPWSLECKSCEEVKQMVMCAGGGICRDLPKLTPRYPVLLRFLAGPRTMLLYPTKNSGLRMIGETVLASADSAAADIERLLLTCTVGSLDIVTGWEATDATGALFGSKPHRYDTFVEAWITLRAQVLGIPQMKKAYPINLRLLSACTDIHV